jgi:hypothetical protein
LFRHALTEDEAEAFRAFGVKMTETHGALSGAEAE